MEMDTKAPVFKSREKKNLFDWNSLVAILRRLKIDLFFDQSKFSFRSDTYGVERKRII